MGVLMLSLFLKTYNLIPDFVGEQDYSDVIYIASINEKVANYAINIADILREEEFPCIIDYRFKSLKSQLSKASELGVLISIVLGPQEMEQNQVVIKNMVTNEQKTIDYKEIIEEIYKIFDQLEDMDDVEEN